MTGISSGLSKWPILGESGRCLIHRSFVYLPFSNVGQFINERYKSVWNNISLFKSAKTINVYNKLRFFRSILNKIDFVLFEAVNGQPLPSAVDRAVIVVPRQENGNPIFRWVGLKRLNKAVLMELFSFGEYLPLVSLAINIIKHAVVVSSTHSKNPQQMSFLSILTMTLFFID